MKIRKERYQYQFSQEEFVQMTRDLLHDALLDGYREGIAEVLYLLTIKDKNPWKKSGIQKLFEDIKSFNMIPPVLGEQITAESVMDYMKSKFDVDVCELPTKIELDYPEEYLKSKLKR